MTSKAKQEIRHIIADLDAAFNAIMTSAKREEDLYEKKYDISDWIYCLYANEEKANNNNVDYKSSLEWLVEQFYQSKDNIAYWDKNWTFDENSTVYAKRFGKFCISKSGEYKLVSPEEFISSSDSNKHHKYVDLRIKRIEISNNAWFYFRGNKYLGTAFLTRIYFNFNYDFEKIVAFSQDLHDALNNWGIPFEYKFATKKTERYDKGVLYTKRENYYIVFHIIKRLSAEEQYTDLFGEDVLAFTKKITLRGISFGEEPPIRSSSFGRYRADIMADIYIDYYNRQKTNKNTKRLETFFFQKMLQIGFSIKDFFRNPSTYYPYHFSVFNQKVQTTLSELNNFSDKYLTWALNAGKLICKQAIVINKANKPNCFWWSLVEDEVHQTEYRRIDDSFYEGRLGIIYFLAKLYSYFPQEYIFKDICRIVLLNIPKEAINSTMEQYIKQIKAYLKLKKKTLDKEIYKESSITPLKKEIDTLLSNTNSYSFINNDAPHPIVNKGYAAIGLILLALFENNDYEATNLEPYYSKEALLKLINHTIF